MFQRMPNVLLALILLLTLVLVCILDSMPLYACPDPPCKPMDPGGLTLPMEPNESQFSKVTQKGPIADNHETFGYID